MDNINEIDLSVDIGDLKNELISSDLWGEYTMRTEGDSPHKQIKDIWVRYKDPKPCIESGDWSSFFTEHNSEWLKDIVDVKSICNKIMAHVNGTQLGGVLITKLSSGGMVFPHTDHGWHAERRVVWPE